VSSRRKPDRADAVAVPGEAGLGKNTDSVSTPGAVRHGRRRTWALRDGLRTMSRGATGGGPSRAAKCGRVRIAEIVGVTLVDGRAGFNGIMTCGLAWECPVCRAAIQAERAKDVLTAVEWHRARRGEAYLVTLTVRHGLGDDLKRMRQGVANAWRKVQAGRAWLEWKARAGIIGTVRALETTHGAHGWHPHLHVLVLGKRASERDVESWRQQLSARWQVAVGATLGQDYTPTDKRGCDMRVSRKSDYLAKLGLEVAGSSEKRGRHANRSPLEIADDWVSRDDWRDGVLWRKYAKGMHGARMLTWSKGLRAAVGLGVEKSDEELAALQEAYTPVALIGREVWDALVRIKGGPVRMLEYIERRGVEGLHIYLEAFVRREHPPP
jgi:hypothetical protein